MSDASYEDSIWAMLRLGVGAVRVVDVGGEGDRDENEGWADGDGECGVWVGRRVV